MRIKGRFILTAAVVFAADQAVKRWLFARMALGETVPVIRDFFHLTLIQNSGMAFGLMQNRGWIYLVSSLAVICVLGYMAFGKTKLSKWQIFAISLVAGGAAGNLADRLAYGAVIDFLDFRGIWPFIFNGADMAIVAGSFLFAICYVRDEFRNGAAEDGDGHE
ncbi:MAG: signal peptidase II [Peptococcaceae bacterium]|nr:signal peptidase II [Peptococcaceae bacterium]